MRIAPIFAVAALAMPVHAAAPAPLTGRWINEDNVAIVEFTPCGNKVCGHIDQFLIAEPKGGARDTENPDKAKRSRKLLGARVFWDMTASGDSWTGQGYQPEQGRTFKAHLSVAGNRLKVKGCVSFFCKTVYWKRAR